MDRRILIVDDGPEIVHRLRVHLRKEGYDIETAGTAARALEIVEGGFRGLIILDLMLPDAEGLELFESLQSIEPNNAIVILTAHGTMDRMRAALLTGAADFLVKGDDLLERLFVSTKNAFERMELESHVLRLKRQLSGGNRFGKLVARSTSMMRVFEQLEQVVDTRVTVLVQGESGTGKELVAKAMHDAGPRKHAPFVPINCAGIPDNLLESELFGYEKGAFTGAYGRKPGKFEAAHGGTIFLDEIGEMPPALQAKILRVLQEREFERVGGTEKIKVDVRVVSATHRDLKQRVEEGAFRQDLYYRLAVFELTLPPLRDRPGDVRLLARHFVQRFAEDENREPNGLSEEALRVIEGYGFPGNVRELENVINHACVVCTDGVIFAEHLPSHVNEGARIEAVRRLGADDLERVFELVMETPEDIPPMAEVETQLIRRSIALCDGQVAAAAERLGISRATMYRRVQKLRIKDSRPMGEPPTRH